MENINKGFVDFVRNLAKNIPIKENNGDYWENGILYCGKCNTPKMCIQFMLGEKLECAIPCECEQKKLDEAKKIREEEQRQIRIANLRREAFSTPVMANNTFENSDKTHPMLNGCVNWTKKFLESKRNRTQIKGLLFAGDKGTGKSYLACCIANAVIDEEYSARYTNFAQIEKETKGFDAKNYLDNLNNCSLLIIDDLGIERDSQYMQEIVFQVIDNRYRTNKPIIITTNLTFVEIWRCQEVERSRIYDRLLEMCVPIEFKGKSYRRKDIGQAVSKYREEWGFD